MTYQDIHLDICGDQQEIAVVRLSRGAKRNALSDALVLGLRNLFEQLPSTVRAAVLDGDGTWHVGGAWISAAGGGCTMPSVGAGSPIWQERIGEVAARQWTPFEGGGSRLRFRVIHPMDTGLAAGIPVFHLEDVRILTEAGDTLARLALYEPVSENPLLSLDFDYVGPVRVEGRDTQGNQVSARVTP